MNSSLQLSPSIRPGEHIGGGTKTERRFFDFAVDGASLYSLLLAKGYDGVGCLGWGGPTMHAEARGRLLAEVSGDFEDGRVALFVCPECGDLGCGAVSVRIRRVGRAIVWEEFGWQTNYEAVWHPIEGLGPFSFDFELYEAAIEAATLLEGGPPEPPESCRC